MSITLICLLIMLALPTMTSWYGGYYRGKSPGGYDNHHPRLQIQELDKYGQRIYAAQQNSWESLIIFMGAVAVVFMAGGDLEAVGLAAILHVIMRIVYIFCYILNRASIRSLLYFGQILCVVYMISTVI